MKDTLKGALLIIGLIVAVPLYIIAQYYAVIFAMIIGVIYVIIEIINNSKSK